MSHYTTIEVKLNIYDISAIKDACKELGLTLRGRGKIRYFYTHDQVTADYVISIPNCPYDVGLVKDEKGNLKIVYDDFQGKVEQILGKNCSKLVQSAIFHKIKRAAQLKGKFISKRVMVKDSVFVEILI